MQNIAIYARVSSEDQQERGAIENPNRVCKKVLRSSSTKHS